MKPHKLAALTIRRGDPPKLDRAMGFKSNGERSRRFTQPLRAVDNFFNGELSPIEKHAKPYLRALASVNPAGAHIQLHDLEYAVWAQGAREVGTEANEVAISLVRGVLEALTAVLRPELATDEREAKVVELGGCVLRARRFVAGPDTDPANEMELPRAA